MSSECGARTGLGAGPIGGGGGIDGMMCSWGTRFIIVIVITVVIGVPAPVIAGGHESNQFEMIIHLHFYVNSHWLSQV